MYWLSVWDGYFKVAVWFLEKNRIEILKSDAGEKTKRRIRDAKTLGKMMTFPVEFDVLSDEEIPDIITMIKCKQKLET